MLGECSLLYNVLAPRVWSGIYCFNSFGGQYTYTGVTPEALPFLLIESMVLGGDMEMSTRRHNAPRPEGICGEAVGAVEIQKSLCRRGCPANKLRSALN